MDNSKRVFTAAPWRWLLWLVVGGVLIYFVLKSGAKSDGSQAGYYIFAAILLALTLLLAFFISRANMVIENGKIQHRTVLGTKSKAVEMSKLIDFHTFIAVQPRQWNTIAKLTDSNGNQIKVRIKTWYLINLPMFNNQKELLNIIQNHVPNIKSSQAGSTPTA